ncbi:hypothetical protein HYH43_07200 [Clostridium botulinum]|uniref:hypothetical protein n=1 Tax=Clostridium botulinum TaxID=1491 RepID=UPI0013F88543|nr:hypothetical protein [Clostridium botulinum]MBY6789224.1 hypothetical protein [Clostridium botulinum]MBY6946573.1 hypothetical protein [Clostridium botulinum]MBY7020201.1 hypothetical protein [Clostridium botulinum]NFI33200.1 hypothetical protein [Clostridium botulinum]
MGDLIKEFYKTIISSDNNKFLYTIKCFIAFTSPTFLFLCIYDYDLFLKMEFSKIIILILIINSMMMFFIYRMHMNSFLYNSYKERFKLSAILIVSEYISGNYNRIKNKEARKNKIIKKLDKQSEIIQERFLKDDIHVNNINKKKPEYIDKSISELFFIAYILIIIKIIFILFKISISKELVIGIIVALISIKNLIILIDSITALFYKGISYFLDTINSKLKILYKFINKESL